MTVIDQEFRFDKSFLLNWVTQSEQEPELPNSIENLIKNDSLVYYNNVSGAVTYRTYRKNLMRFEGYKTIILDATSVIDKDYEAVDCQIMKLTKTRSYENLIINHCNSLEVSRSFLKSRLDYIIESILKDIQALNKTCLKPLFINCFKDINMGNEKIPFKDMIKDSLQDVINNGEPIISHFGGNKGSNEMRNCSTILNLGVQNFGYDYYRVKAMAQGQPVEAFEQYMLSELAVEIIQDIFRTKLRNHYLDEEVEVYLITKNDDLVNLIKSYFSESKMKIWTAINILTDDYMRHTYDKESAKTTKLVRVLLERLKEKGDWISKNEAMIEAGIDSKNYRKRLLYDKEFADLQLILMMNNISWNQRGKFVKV